MIPKNPQSKRTTDALVKAARKVCRINQQRVAMDWAFGKLMTTRYGDRWEMPEVLTNAIDEGNGKLEDITLENLDYHMTQRGYPPLKP